MSGVESDKYKFCNHHHELTEDHVMVDFGNGAFVANKMAVPLLKALADLGLRTRTHHVDSDGGFFSIMLDPTVEVEIRQIHERASDRDTYNGQFEVLIGWR